MRWRNSKSENDSDRTARIRALNDKLRCEVMGALAEVQPLFHARVVSGLKDHVATVIGQCFKDSLPVSGDALLERGTSVVALEMFFWLRDNRNAVLLISRDGKDALAFATTDPELIMGRSQIFEQKLRFATLGMA
jgi:hypothetical protein